MRARKENHIKEIKPKEMKWRTEKGSRKEQSNVFTAHTYVASMTTPTPVGCRASVIATAICLVNLS